MKKRYAFILIFVALILVRFFWLEPYYIPSGSMIPTLLKGDYIWIDKLAYGFRNPFTGKLYSLRQPERGDVIVFKFSGEDRIEFIKRVIGLPGDVLAIKGQTLFINHRPIQLQQIEVERALKQDNCQAQLNPQSENLIPAALKPLPYARDFRMFNYFEEKLDESSSHWIQTEKSRQNELNDFQVLVPAHHVFVMGDNRNRSHDSREMGPVHISDVIGKATSVWLSMNEERFNCAAGWLGTSRSVRWYRWGKEII